MKVIIIYESDNNIVITNINVPLPSSVNTLCDLKELIFMMMIPRRHSFDLFDDMFGDSFFNEGESKLMKTDIKEKKINISLTLICLDMKKRA